MNPQFDDIEAELSYLWVRSAAPEAVVELSPFRGWSTTWLLHALRDNGGGRLTSFDLVPDSRHFVPAGLAEGRWELVPGDVRESLDRMPDRIDYLFVDSDHSAPFARWYLEELVGRLEPGTPVSVHDIYHRPDPGRVRGEPAVLLAWLRSGSVPHFSASPHFDPAAHAAIEDARRELGLGQRIHFGRHESAVFLRAP